MRQTTIEEVILHGVGKLWGTRIAYETRESDVGEEPETEAHLDVRGEDGSWMRVANPQWGGIPTQVEAGARAIRDEIARQTGRVHAIGCVGELPGTLRSTEDGHAIDAGAVEQWRVRRNTLGEIECEALEGERWHAVGHPFGESGAQAKRWLHLKAIAASRSRTQAWDAASIARAAKIEIDDGDATRRPRASDATIERVGVIRTGPATYQLQALHGDGVVRPAWAGATGQGVNHADAREAIACARDIAKEAGAAGGQGEVPIDVSGEWPPGSGRCPGLEDLEILEGRSPGARNERVLDIEVARDGRTGAVRYHIQSMDEEGRESTRSVPAPTPEPQAAESAAQRIAETLWARHGLGEAGRPRVHGTSTEDREPAGGQEPTRVIPQTARVFADDERFPISASRTRGPTGEIAPHCVVLDAQAGVRPAHLLSEPCVEEGPAGTWQVWVKDAHAGGRHALEGSACNDAQRASEIAARARENLEVAREAHQAMERERAAQGAHRTPLRRAAALVAGAGIVAATAAGIAVTAGAAIPIAATLGGALALASAGGLWGRRLAGEAQAKDAEIVRRWQAGGHFDATRTEREAARRRQEFTEMAPAREQPGTAHAFTPEEDWASILATRAARHSGVAGQTRRAEPSPETEKTPVPRTARRPETERERD